jgi:uncharacterized protein YecE (DUF72 family)
VKQQRVSLCSEKTVQISEDSPKPVRIGTSGFHYRHWKGIFYPDNLPSKGWLAYYARQFDTVELNNTFYRLPPAESFDQWKLQAPRKFDFAVKFSRYGSHVMRLKNAEDVIRRFYERAQRLREHLGPILVQLPPNWNVNARRLSEFLDAAPSSQRWAVEFRDSRWLNQEVFAVLRSHKAALCIHDKIVDHPREITADWTYIRFHGGQYDGNYSDAELTAYSGEINGYLRSGFAVYVYFNNDWHGYALRNAATLRALLGRDRARAE